MGNKYNTEVRSLKRCEYNECISKQIYFGYIPFIIEFYPKGNVYDDNITEIYLKCKINDVYISNIKILFIIDIPEIEYKYILSKEHTESLGWGPPYAFKYCDIADLKKLTVNTYIQIYIFNFNFNRMELYLVKVMEIMYESFPSLALQMYLLLLKENKCKTTVTASMIAVCGNASVSMWIYLVSINQMEHYKNQYH